MKPDWQCGNGGARFIQQLRAVSRGYFWLPCVVCDRKFGGHEVLSNNVIFNLAEPWRGTMVCSAECRDFFNQKGNVMMAEVSDDLSAEPEVTWTTPFGDRVVGVIVDRRKSGSVMQTERGDFEGVQFQIETSDGKKQWTCTFADPTKPVTP